MKKAILALSIVLFLCVPVLADGEAEKPPQSICPKTLMKESCLSCHTRPSFKIKEAEKYETLDLPSDVSVVEENGIKKWYYFNTGVNPGDFLDLFNYIDNHNDISKNVVIEIHNSGGDAFGAWRCVNIILSNWEKYDIETRLYGIAFSAGFLIFNAGEVRSVAPTAELMWHEIAYFVMFDKVSPQRTEDKLKMMRHLQDTANEWLVERTGNKMSKDELDNKASNEQGWWFNGKEAFQFGFADKLI